MRIIRLVTTRKEEDYIYYVTKQESLGMTLTLLVRYPVGFYGVVLFPYKQI